jgi:hypothetical protein
MDNKRWYTTIIIGKRWHRRLKVEAAKREVTMTEILHEALDEWFMNHSEENENRKEKE